MEIDLVKAFNWSLRDIDETDIESLLPFVARLTGGKMLDEPMPTVYCDEVDWL